MKIRPLFLILPLLFLSACNGGIVVGLEPLTLPTLSIIPLTNTPFPTETSTPTATLMVAPPANTLPDLTNSSGTTLVKVFLIAIDDNGQSGTAIGCGDSAIPVQVEVPSTQEVLRAAMTALLSIKTQYYGESGLYNALYQTDLQVADIQIDSGKAKIYLTGTMMMGGECDIPRVQAQLEQTALQFSTVTEVTIFINSIPLADALSLKG